MLQILAKFNRKLAVLQARYTIQLSMHPIIMLICFFIGAMHTWITVLYPNNQVIIGIKYLQPTMLLDKQVMLYVFAIPVITVVLYIFRQIFMAFVYEATILNTVDKYLTKILGNLGWIASITFTLPVVRTSIYAIKQLNGLSNALGWINLLAYSIILVPFYGIFLQDPSPCFGNSYATTKFFNYYRVMPLIRLIMAYANVLQKLASVGFVYTFLIISLFMFLKQPIMFYSYDRYFRLTIYLMTWIMMVRGTANIDDAPIAGAAIALISPIFVISLFWLTDIRISRILYDKAQKIKKYVYFVYMLKNFYANLRSSLLFLLYHRKDCENPECICRLLDSAKQKDKEGKHIIWYKFAVSVIEQSFNIESLDTLVPSEKKVLLAKLVDIGIVQIDIMSNILKKWISSYYYLQKIHNYCEQQNWICHIFNSYRLKFIRHMTQYLQQTYLQEGAANQYASAYFEYQKNIQNLILSLQKSTQSYLEIWKQLKNYEPDCERLCSLIRKNYRNQIKVEKIIKKINRNHKEAKKIIIGYYQPYFLSVCNTFIEQISVTESVNAQKLSKQMQNFSFDSKTGASLVTVNEGQQFGRIIYTNLYFELTTGFSAKYYLNVDELIAFDQALIHRAKMSNYLHNNEISRPEIKGFIKTKNGLIKQVQILIQFYPSAMKGLMACVFIIQNAKKNIFCCDSSGKILSYNNQFKQNIYQLYSYILNENSLLSAENLQILKQSSKCEIFLESDKFQISVMLTKGQKEKQQLKYICQVSPKQQCSSFQTKSQNEIPQTMIQLEKTIQPSSNLVNSQARQSQTKEFKNKSRQKQQIEQVFKIVQNNKSVKNITIWTVCLVLLCLIIQSLIIAIIATSFQKQNLLVEQLQIKNDTQMSLGSIVNSLYFFRKAHITANSSLTQESKFSYYQQIFGKQNRMASESLKKNNFFTRKMQGKLMSVSQQKQISEGIEDYYVTLQQKVLVIITNFEKTTQQDLQFPLRIQDLNPPLNNYEQNYAEINLNGLKGGIPYFKQIAQQINTAIKCQIGGCIHMFAPVYILPIILLVNFILIIASCVITYKVKSIKYSTYKLLIEFPEQDITIREDKIAKYVSTNILYQCDKNSLALPYQSSNLENHEIGATLKIIQKNMKGSYKAPAMERILTRQIGLQDTHRSLVCQKEQINKQQPPIVQKKKKRKIVFKELSKKNIFCKYCLLFIPSLLLLTSMILLFFISNSVSLNEVNNLSLFYERMRTIRQIKLYNLQIGLKSQLGLTNSITIEAQLNKMISYLYEVQRKIKEMINPNDNSIGQIVQQFNQENVCVRLGKLSLNPNFQMNFTKEQCSNLVGKDYLTKGMMNSLVSFLQQSRVIQQKYGLNLTENQVQQFLALYDHELFNKLDYYFFAIINYEIRIYIDKIIKSGLVSSIIMLVLGLLFSFYIWISLFILLTIFKRSMFRDITQIKSIYQLISQDTIRNSKKLMKIAIQENDYGFLK